MFHQQLIGVENKVFLFI